MSSAVLRKDIVNLLDFIERLKNEEDQIALDVDQIEKLKLELTFISTFLQLSYSNLDGFSAKMSRKAQQVDDMVQSIFYKSEDDLLVKYDMDHAVAHVLENIQSYISSHHYPESNATMTEAQLVELLDALLVNLHDLPKCCAKLILPLMTQYELLRDICGNLRDFLVLKVNGYVEHETVEYVLPQFQLMAERVGHFCFDLLSCQLDEIDEADDSDEIYDSDETSEPHETDDSDETSEPHETDDPDEIDETAEPHETDSPDEIYDSDETDETAEPHETDSPDEIYDSDEILHEVNSMIVHLFLKIIPVELEVMHICSTYLKASKSAEVGHFIKHLLEASPGILREYLTVLQAHMVTVLSASTSARNIHVMMEFLLIILADLPKEHFSGLLARVGALTMEVSILVCNLEDSSRNEENMNETNCATLGLLESIELMKEDLKHVFLKAPADSSQLCFPMSDGPLFMTLLLKKLNDLLNSNVFSVALIKKEIGLVKEGLEFIRSIFGKVEQELYRDLWTRVLDVAYEAEHAIKSILVRDHGLLQLIFLLPVAVEKIKRIKKEVLEKISKNKSLIVVNSLNKLVERKSSTAGQIIVGFKEETEWIIRKLISEPGKEDVISIIGMPGLGKTTLAYKVYNDKSVVDHFDVRAWCTVDQERNVKKLLQKIYNQVVGLGNRFSEDDIDDDVADKLRKQLFGKRYLIVLDDLWDNATWDELTMPFPVRKKGSRVILTSRKKDVALHGKRHSDPLNLRLLRLEESWELLEKRLFGEEHCPDELKEVGEKIARTCDGLPLVLDLICGVLTQKEKKEASWLEVLNNLNSFIFKDEEEVMKVVQLSYDHLPDHLKPCLIYLASYPKDEDIEISELKALWSAEGLVEQIEMKSVEEVLELYVNDLISSSLVIAFNERGWVQSCKIHDLVHEFCSIKARKEKLFDFTNSNAPLSSSSSSSSSSSDLMPRGMTIHYDHPDENVVLFNPEKKNPYVKHLLSLKVIVEDGRDTCLSYSCHLQHLRLLKRLELRNIRLTDSLLNEIGMLFHLRCLNIWTETEALPPSLSNLCNLETLVVENWGSTMIVSPSIWSLAKLRRFSIDSCTFFYWDGDGEPKVLEEDWKLENLRILDKFRFSCLDDTEDIFKRFPNLRSLTCEISGWDFSEEIYFPRLDVLNELEEVSAWFQCRKCSHAHHWDFHFPLSLKELDLKGFDLSSDSLSGIARLPNLQILHLRNAIIEGKEWNMEEVTFENLRSLKLESVSFSEWQVGEESFFLLEELRIQLCDELMEIPDSFGDIASLKSIYLVGNRQLVDSAIKVKKYVAEMTGEDKLEVKLNAVILRPL